MEGVLECPHCGAGCVLRDGVWICSNCGKEVEPDLEGSWGEYQHIKARQS